MTTDTQRLLSISCFHHWRDTSTGEQKIDGVIWSLFIQENRPTGGESNETRVPNTLFMDQKLTTKRH